MAALRNRQELQVTQQGSYHKKNNNNNKKKIGLCKTRTGIKKTNQDPLELLLLLFF